MSAILIEPIEGDAGGDRAGASLPKRESPVRRSGLETPRRAPGLPKRAGADDPLLESWQKLLAKYRRK
jgi:hypothetical protein